MADRERTAVQDRQRELKSQERSAQASEWQVVVAVVTLMVSVVTFWFLRLTFVETRRTARVAEAALHHQERP